MGNDGYMNLFHGIFCKGKKVDTPKCLWAGDWLKKLGHIHAKEYHTARKMNEETLYILINISNMYSFLKIIN